MPTYDYECTQCGRKFELFQSITARPKKIIKTQCQQCHDKAPVKRCIGIGGGLIFKGSGFYATDYRSEGYKKAAKAEKESQDGKASSDKKTQSTKTDSKSETTTPQKKPSAQEKN